ncbi:DinB family protein [Desulfosporosinus sp. PR]|uniref:DinB family protein n=1 Tax=Candidatus Desulfosporosinus nitrosoreducens TaxID=3401928 RepID=UPI0027F1416E|nr:DinB family protein [Desulfosporosinus sp. PR]MDQ7095248.1 DinB family protein [Desulfosporosinus sp. PR]
MVTSIAVFLETWEKEEEATLRILNALTDDSLSQKVSEEDRSLGRIAWHVATTIPEMMSKTGLVFEGCRDDDPVPNSAQSISDYYQKVSKIMVAGIRARWQDQTLLEKRNMYGEQWTIGETLSALVDHQIHHRGQMTVLMRQAGLKVPGLYGPAREDWSQFGMKAPAI